MLKNVAKSMTIIQLASCLTVSIQMTTCQVPPETFKSHPSTCVSLIGPQKKQTEEVQELRT